MPKRLRVFLDDRPQAVAAVTQIFLKEIARLLCAAADLPSDADTPGADRPRLGAISFLHRYGSVLTHHVHLHACVTDGVFMPATNGLPAFFPTRPVTNGVVKLWPFEFLDRHAVGGHATGACSDSSDKPLSHDTSRIA